MPQNNTRLNTSVPIIENRENYFQCIPVITDIHILAKEPNNRNGVMLNRAMQVLDELTEMIEANKCTAVIFTGDIADRGFSRSELNYESTIISKLAKISDLVDGNCYAVLGNHEVTYSKNNLFYAMSSLDSEIIKQQLVGKEIPKCIYPYIHTPNCLDFGDLKIHLMHFNSSAKNYKVMTADTKFNIAIYHDDLITFESMQELYHHKIGKGISVTSTDIFENVDWAIMGHIHTPLTTFTLNNVRNTVIDTPGSMLSRTIAEKHEKVKLPFICINENGFERQYVDFNIGSYDESVNSKIVKAEQQKREMAKILKNSTTTVTWTGYDDFVASIMNGDIKDYIVQSENPLKLKSIELKDSYIKDIMK